jgi:RimJ/RimL family protein N-acetyltransferase
MHQYIPYTPATTVFSTKYGERVRMRDVVPQDTLLLTDLLLGLSDNTRWLRYLAPCPQSFQRAWQEATRMTQPGTHHHAVLVATIRRGDSEAAIAVAEVVCDQHTATIGELAIVVRDDYQTQGVGSALSNRLALSARALGITTVRADILYQNRAAQRLMRRVFGPATATRDQDVVTMIAPLSNASSSA